MKLKNIKYLRYIKWGSLFYEKYGQKKIGMCLAKYISKKTQKALLKNSQSVVCVKFDHINPVGQATHPDVIYPSNILPSKYVLTVSGYPFNLGKYENQFVFTSDSGTDFTNTMGNNAVVTYEGNGRSHYSDGEIIEYNGRFILYYRMCYEDCANPHVTIYYRESATLHSWSEEKELFTAYKTGYLSPAIIKNNHIYQFYYVDREIETNSFKRYQSATPFFDNSPQEEELEIINAPSNRRLWHLDIVCDGNILRGLFVFTLGYEAEDTKLYYAESTDGGKTWIVGDEIKLDINYKIVKRVYRSSMVCIDGKWNIYVSVCTKNNCWFLLRSTGHTF